MSYDILKNLGLNQFDADSPDFLDTLQQMQREAWQSLRNDAPAVAGQHQSSIGRSFVQANDDEAHWTDDDLLAAADATPWPEIPAWEF